jgi:hypothetical protein
VRASFLVTTAVVTAAWLSACSSAPSHSANDPDLDPNAAGRDIRLVEPAVTQPSSVSDLEAGRTAKYPRVRLPDQRIEAARPAPSLETAIETRPAVAAVTTGEILAPTAIPAAAPAEAVEATEIVRAPAMPTWRAGDGEDVGAMAGHQPWGMARGGPTVIIRGGRGGPDDDCDLTRPGVHHGPMAVNRLAPPLGGRIRGGIR